MPPTEVYVLHYMPNVTRDMEGYQPVSFVCLNLRTLWDYVVKDEDGNECIWMFKTYEEFAAKLYNEKTVILFKNRYQSVKVELTYVIE
jgi:hypothetical protein